MLLALSRTRPVLLVVALAFVAFVGACGGGPTAKERWVKAASTACDTRAKAIEVASAQLTAQSTAEQFAQFFAQFFEPAYRAQLEAQRAAAPPDDTARALIDDTAKVLDAIAVSPGDYAVAADPFADVDVRWDGYGLVPCGTRTEPESASSNG
ncbi:MAG: hypothetical protein ACR2LQ_03740 [Acidimicrobiales bacterium]